MSTLLVIVVLTIIVVAFLQSMTIEQQTARSYLNRYKAELAADAAQSLAISRVEQLMTQNPYHSIGYLYAPGTTPPVSTTDFLDRPTNYPVLYGAASPTAAPIPAPYYLISIPSKTDPTQIFTTSLTPTDWPSTLVSHDNQTSVAINFKKTTADDDPGWMGSPVDATSGTVTKRSYRECRAPWIYILQDPSKAHQADPAAANYNPYISRYAYWVEDETSKIDLLKAGNASGTGGAFQPPKTENLAGSSNSDYKDAVAWKPSDLDLGAIPIKDGKALAVGDGTSNQNLINTLHTPDGYPRDASILGQVTGFDKSAPAARFYTTVGSISNELAGNGRRRVNINSLVHDSANPPNPKVIASDIDDIAYAISGSHVFANASSRSPAGLFNGEEDDTINALLPNFGERLWPSTDSSLSLGINRSLLNSSKKSIYLIKLAANIRDYIDSDSNPTFVDWDHTQSPPVPKVISGTDAPKKEVDPALGTFPNLSNNDLMPIAIGQEAVPYLIKCAFVVTYSTATVGVNETFSFFNPSTKNFTAPSGTYLRCFDRLQWTIGGFGHIKMPSYYLDLSGANFPAGQVVVITSSKAGSSPNTDPPTLPGNALRPPMTPSNACTYPGSTSYTPAPRDGSYDVSTKIIMGDSNGSFGGFGAVTLTNFIATGSGNYTMNSGNTRVTRSNSMQGNDQTSHTGDARSINEALTFNKAAGAKGVAQFQEQARFWDDTNLDLSKPDNSFINPTLWPDFTRAFINLQDQSYAVIRDQPMTSIGELGNIYDPYRRSGASSFIDYARAGGRTLRIGQPDDVIAPASDSLSQFSISADQTKSATTDAGKTPRFGTTPPWGNAAWQLTDVFDVILNPTSGLPVTTTHLVPPQAEGKLNINSVMRDNGAALRTLLRGFKFLVAPYSDRNLSNQPLSPAEIDKIVAAVMDYLAKNGPMLSRGELSQLLDSTKVPIFSGNSMSFGSQKMYGILDRGREEIFRRLIDVLTTRSASFTIYAVGQSLREQPATPGQPTILSTVTKGVTYRLDPVISGNTGSAITDTKPNDKVTAFAAVPLYVHP